MKGIKDYILCLITNKHLTYVLFSLFKKTSFRIPLKYHLIFWVGYFLVNLVRWGSYYEDYWYSFKSNLITVTLGLILAYFHVYFLLPKFLSKKKIIHYIFFFLISLVVFYIIRTELIFLYINENVWPESQTPQRAYSFNHVLAVFLIGIYDVTLATAIKLTVEWIYEKQKAENLKKLQLRTELNFLKSQIQPHFFFNTLNNIYALTLEKSDIAPSVVLKLSDIMQYVLYDVKEPFILLSTEIKYIQNYLDLEEMRHGDTVKVKITIQGVISGVHLPPLLFLPFIENCYKHGIKGNDQLKIKIGFKLIENKKLIFTTENNFVNTASIAKHGIGNQNVKRRLELLYKNSFELKSKISKDVYKVKMSIPINQDQ